MTTAAERIERAIENCERMSRLCERECRNVSQADWADILAILRAHAAALRAEPAGLPAEPAPGEDERAIEKLEAWLPMGADKDKVILYIEARLASIAALKQERDALRDKVRDLDKQRLAEIHLRNIAEKQTTRVIDERDRLAAELAEARPLLEAVGYYRQSIEGHYATKIERAMITTEGRKVLEAALAYRAKKGA